MAVVGSVNVDHVLRVERLPRDGDTLTARSAATELGGKGANQAVAAARWHAQVALVAAVGADDGQEPTGRLALEGVDTSHVARVDAPTGQAHVVVADNGANQIIVVPGANGALGAAHVESALRSIRPDWVLVQCEISEDAVRAACATSRLIGARTLLNAAPAREYVTGLAGDVDCLVVNENEFAELFGRSAAAQAPPGWGLVVVTMGEQGSRLLTQTGSLETPAIRVDAVDTVGAGDAFCGALVGNLASGEPWDRAVDLASRFAALQVTRRGALGALPTAAETLRTLDD